MEYYLRDLEVLRAAYDNSLRVITAWDGSNLVGVIRAAGDGYTILHIQDILVQSEYRRKGISWSGVCQIPAGTLRIRERRIR